MTNIQYFAIAATIFYAANAPKRRLTFAFWIAIAGVIISAIGEKT